MKFGGGGSCAQTVGQDTENTEMIRIWFLDASALVKLVAREPDSGPLRGIFLGSASSFHTNLFCVAEALGVLKVKWLFRKEISEQQYFEFSDLLLAYVRNQTIHLDETDLDDNAVLGETEALARRHKLDLSDALQLYTLQSGSFKSFAGESTPLLITADADLAQAGRSEGIRVWNCIKEPVPV